VASRGTVRRDHNLEATMNRMRMALALVPAAALMMACEDKTAPMASRGAPPSPMVLGQLDPGHTYVGAIILDTPSPPLFPVSSQPWYCSGTLLSSRVVQTAAHCLAFAAQDAGYPADGLPASLIHVSFAGNGT